MHTLIIGDIHGCYDELQALLDAAAIGADDLILAVGDVVDRGPATGAVTDFFRSRRTAEVVMGNHERKHVRWAAGEVAPAPSQRIARRELGDAAHADAVAWMAGLPTFRKLPEVLVVHAMMEPGLPVEAQRENVIVGTLSGEAYLKQVYDRPWFELYDGELPVVVGHHDLTGRSEPYVRADQMVYGIDTRCCTGGKLTGLLLPEFRLVSVPAREDYWSQQQARHRDLWKTKTRADGSFSFGEIAALLDDDAEPEGLAPGQIERLEALLIAGEAAVARLVAAAEQAHRVAVEQLGGPKAFEALPLEEQGRRYAALIADKRLAPLMHACRKGADPAARARSMLKPGRAVELAAEMGLMDGVG